MSYHVGCVIQHNADGRRRYVRLIAATDGPITESDIATIEGNLGIAAGGGPEGDQGIEAVVLSVTPIGVPAEIPADTCAPDRWCRSLAAVLGPIGDPRDRGLIQVIVNRNGAGAQICIAYQAPKGRRAHVYIQYCPYCSEDVRNGIFLAALAEPPPVPA